jgi:hypothetical protein
MNHIDAGSWIALLPLIAASCVVFFVPGAFVLWCARIPWFLALPVAPAITVCIAASGAVAVQFLGIPWGLATFAILTIISAVVAFGIGRWIKPSFPGWTSVRGRFWWGAVGTIIGCLITMLPLAAGIRDSSNPSQAWDAVFHLNAVQYILQSGHASSLTLGVVSNPALTTSYYPAGWHDVIALLAAPSTVASAANAGSLVIAGLIWPAGLALLSAIVFPRQRQLALLLPILGSSFVAFPARMLSYGTLWPNALATALLPSLIALLILLLRPSLQARTRAMTAVVFALALLGAALAHPTSVVAVAYLGVPLYIARLWPSVRRRWNEGHRAAVSLVVAAVVVGVPVLLALAVRLPLVKAVVAYPRAQYMTHAQAFGEALFDSMFGTTGFGTPSASWLIAALTVVGFVLLLRRKGTRWIPFSYLISVGLYMVAAGPDSPLRLFVGFWYTDPVRLGGLIPLFAAVLAAYATYWCASALTIYLRRHLGRPGRRTILLRAPLAFTITLILVGVGTSGFRFSPRESEMYIDYVAPLTSPTELLTRPEIAMIRKTPSVIPAHDVTLGNPFNGSAYLYSLGDRPVLLRHLSGALTPDMKYAIQHFRQLGKDPRVCRILNSLNVKYFYYDPHVYFPSDLQQKTFASLSPKGLSSQLSEVDRGGSAVIYKITGCG